MQTGPDSGNAHAGPDPAGTDGPGGGEAIGRRRVLSGTVLAGLAAASAAVLAACGRSGGSPAAGGTKLSAATQIPVGGGKIFDADHIVVTQPAKGEYHGFSATCTHRGCTVNRVSGGTIRCPCHGSQFSIEDGSVKAGPAPKPLPRVPLKVKNGEISVA